LDATRFGLTPHAKLNLDGLADSGLRGAPKRHMDRGDGERASSSSGRSSAARVPIVPLCLTASAPAPMSAPAVGTHRHGVL